MAIYTCFEIVSKDLNRRARAQGKVGHFYLLLVAKTPAAAAGSLFL